MDGKIDAITDNTISGVGIRAFLGTRTVYGHTSDISEKGLISCARSVAAAISDKDLPANVVLTERIFQNIHPVKILPTTADMKIKSDLLKAACASGWTAAMNWKA